MTEHERKAIAAAWLRAAERLVGHADGISIGASNLHRGGATELGDLFDDIAGAFSALATAFEVGANRLLDGLPNQERDTEEAA